MSWTDERVETLKRLWMEGLSASQIAAQLGEGVTRNAVIGKVHRLKLSARAKPAASTSRQRAARPARRSSGGGGGGGGKRRVVTTTVVGATALAPQLDAETEVEAMPKPLDELYIPPAERIGLLGLTEKTCKWPIGDPLHDDFHFCGHESEENRPYCTFHSAKAYHTIERKKR